MTGNFPLHPQLLSPPFRSHTAVVAPFVKGQGGLAREAYPPAFGHPAVSVLEVRRAAGAPCFGKSFAIVLDGDE